MTPTDPRAHQDPRMRDPLIDHDPMTPENEKALVEAVQLIASWVDKWSRALLVVLVLRVLIGIVEVIIHYAK